LHAFAVAFTDLPAEIFRLDQKRAPFEGAVDGDGERVDLDRLGEVVLGAGPHRSHCSADVAERGGHDHGKLRVLLAEFGKELHAVQSRHAQIGDHDVGRALRGQRQGLLTVAGAVHLVAGLLEELLEPAARAGLVVDHEQSCFVRHPAISVPSGNVTLKRVLPGRLSTSMMPL
jgi:hypothetical protein